MKSEVWAWINKVIHDVLCCSHPTKLCWEYSTHQLSASLVPHRLVYHLHYGEVESDLESTWQLYQYIPHWPRNFPQIS